MFILNWCYVKFTELHITVKYWKNTREISNTKCIYWNEKNYPRSEMCHVSVLTNLTLGDKCLLGDLIISECPTKNLRDKEFALFGEINEQKVIRKSF